MGDPHQHAALTAAEHKSVTRIESFSDIVFGFSLFNLAFNLRVPATPNELLSQIPQFIIFAITFGLLCFFWWLHHRLFREYYKPDSAGVILNFAFLASIALFTYPLQLYFKFGPRDPVTVGGYAAGSFLVFGLFAVLFLKGVLQLGGALGSARRGVGLGIGVRCAVIALSMAVSLSLYSVGQSAMIYAIVWGAVIVLAQRMIERLRNRLAPRGVAEQ